MGEAQKKIQPKSPKKITKNDSKYKSKLSKENEKLIKIISAYKD
jgi:hypothetical protein